MTDPRYNARDDDSPEMGHTFHIEVASRGSYAVVGEPGHTDADHFGPPMTLDVRAWDLPAALRKAAAVPLNEWGSDD